MPSPDVAGWAASGAMDLTGAADGPPMIAPGDPAGAVRRGLGLLGGADPGPQPPGPALLGERAAASGLARSAPWSCGGAFRALMTRDGWWGLSLPRRSDLDLVPALVERDIAPGGPENAWSAVAAWALKGTAAEAAARGRLLGLACAEIPDHPVTSSRPGVLISAGGRRTAVPERPLVVDFTSLWAGPLCAHLLASTGARVVKVESRHRPDGARLGAAEFFDLLHTSAQMVAVDFDDPTGRAALRDLVARADLVLEASRPRALTAIGIDARELVESGVSWLSITARGRASDAVGFGDDVAAGAGLVRHLDGVPVPVGDALADPITGVAAAAAAHAALADSHACLIDVSMHDVCVEATGPVPEHEVQRHADGWWVEWAGGRAPVAKPRARRPRGSAAASGADNDTVLTRSAR